MSLGVVKDEPAVAGERAVASNGPRAAELRQMRAREQAAQEQLSLARKRIAQLEKELESDRPRHEFDLTPEDWKHLADNGIIKYRLPCANSNAVPTDRVLDELGLAPEDREVFRGAFENSGKRLREKLVPLCAAALGGANGSGGVDERGFVPPHPAQHGGHSRRRRFGERSAGGVFHGG